MYTALNKCHLEVAIAPGSSQMQGLQSPGHPGEETGRPLRTPGKFQGGVRVGGAGGAARRRCAGGSRPLPAATRCTL